MSFEGFLKEKLLDEKNSHPYLKSVSVSVAEIAKVDFNNGQFPIDISFIFDGVFSFNIKTELTLSTTKQEPIIGKLKVSTNYTEEDHLNHYNDFFALKGNIKSLLIKAYHEFKEMSNND